MDAMIPVTEPPELQRIPVERSRKILDISTAWLLKAETAPSSPAAAMCVVCELSQLNADLST